MSTFFWSIAARLAGKLLLTALTSKGLRTDIRELVHIIAISDMPSKEKKDVAFDRVKDMFHEYGIKAGSFGANLLIELALGELRKFDIEVSEE